ncbi:MAG: polyprenyl diphosphate synthase [Spirochaetia bacterium]
MKDKMPVHVGIIMDGNGRWATHRGQSRTQGHLEGLKTTKKIVACASKMGIKYISLYVFSTENWKRTQQEVGFLMSLVTQHLRSEYEFYQKKSIRVVHSGDLTGLPDVVQQAISGVEADTASFEEGLTVNLLINYGGCDEILRAAERICKANVPFSREEFEKHLDRPALPALDLVIRTAGEQRLSNFMIWQASYAEFYFSQKLWPDFSEKDFENAIDMYTQRSRRFGGY